MEILFKVAIAVYGVWSFASSLISMYQLHSLKHTVNARLKALEISHNNLCDSVLSLENDMKHDHGSFHRRLDSHIGSGAIRELNDHWKEIDARSKFIYENLFFGENCALIDAFKERKPVFPSSIDFVQIRSRHPKGWFVFDQVYRLEGESDFDFQNRVASKAHQPL